MLGLLFQAMMLRLVGLRYDVLPFISCNMMKLIWKSVGKASFGTKLREGSSIGPVCRVGGEVEESIIHGYSNKYHDGFLTFPSVSSFVESASLKNSSASIHLRKTKPRVARSIGRLFI